MKKILILTALLVLHGCSGSEPVPDAAPLPLAEDSAAAAPAGDVTLASDPFLADQGVSPTLSATASATESHAADSLLATPVPSDSGSGSVKMNPESEQALASPTPSESVPVPSPALSQNHEVRPTSPMPPAKTDPRKFNSYDAYKEYQAKEESRRELQKSFDDRGLFPHEDGAWQIGLDYARNAFPSLDFDPTAVNKTFDTFGGVFSVGYFPIRSLSYGRLGLSANYSVFWTKYLFQTGPTTNEKSTVHSIDSYGAKAVYEFDYLLGQLVVPFAYYGMDKVTVKPYSLSSGTSVVANYPKNTFNRTVFGAGMHLNLNRLEAQSASRALASVGIRKTYLTYTFLAEAGAGTGSSHFLGLRFEY